MIAILADDLTSALDGAAPFASSDSIVRVLLDPTADIAGAAVVAFDLSSRFLDSVAANRKFKVAAQRVRDADVLLKTIVSTLRGNLYAETVGAMDGGNRCQAFIAPAFPAAGRTTAQGVQLVDGIPVAETAFTDDPRTPIRNSLVAAQFEPFDPALFSICDARSDADLDTIVADRWRDQSLLWVGSPGLAAALARCVSLVPETSVMRCPSVKNLQSAGRVLVVVGSVHPTNAAQIAALTGPVIRLDDFHDTSSTIVKTLIAALNEHGSACLVAPPINSAAPRDPAAVAEMLGRYAAAARPGFDGLVVTGGDTARCVADALRAIAIDVTGEIEPGVPLGLLRTLSGDLAFVTKAGGFGDPLTLQRCINAISEKEDHNVT